MKTCSTLGAFALALVVAAAYSSSGRAADAAAPASPLAGTSWQLVQFQGGDGKVLKPDVPSNYTVQFDADGNVSLRLDCNRGRGLWKSPAPSRLELAPLALTRAMCPQMTLHDQVVKQWTLIHSYQLRNAHLFLSVTADGGTYELEPVSTQTAKASWLDEPKPASWNEPGQSIPRAPSVNGNAEARCRELARPPEQDADRRVHAQGWDLVGPFQGGWQILVIGGTAGYDGMCRPLGYQNFVFVHGVFAGTLSPTPMNSRTDGILRRVFMDRDRHLIAEYERYAATDPLCCASRTTTVAFEIAAGGPVVRPVSAATSPRK